MAGRCAACNSVMSDADMCRKHAETGEYLDLCGRCLREVVSIVRLPIDGASLYDTYIPTDEDELEK